MNHLSIAKTRWLFLTFFFALAVPSIILTFKAHQQLRWQTLHQYQQDIRAFVRQVDNDLMAELAKEEARSDTEYTFFVLAGAPEARFVQRSELSKFPVESNIPGVLGYFQINQAGEFSSPILPSADVQSEVVPQLYGISIAENIERKQLEQKMREILSQNQFVIGHKRDENKPTISQQKNELAVAEKRSIRNDGGELLSDEVDYLSKRTSVNMENKKANEKLKSKQAIAFKTKAQTNKKQRQSKRAFYPNSPQDSDKKEKRAVKKRVSRVEKNFSPQQSLAKTDNNTHRVAQNNIQIDLFESEIEPFKFNQLQSGQFILYRKVLRENKPVVQGAIIESKPFLQHILQAKFVQSSLVDVALLKAYFSDQLLSGLSFNDNADSSKILTSSTDSTLRGELLAEVPLSEPFSQFTLEFRVAQLPTAAGASFITAIASSLLFVLILGTYLLYRLTIKQFYLAQQQQNFVSSVSHELKTPLTSIRMYGEILKQGWLSDEKRDQYYDYIYTEAERLSRLIANVLQISKVNQNALVLNLTSVDISELLSLIKSKVDSQITHSGFNLQMALDPRLKDHSLLVDPDGFVQIVINLVDNAIKFAGKSDKKQLDISFELDAFSKVKISVRDYGPGIEKKYIKHIFELFYRSGNELTRETTGTGIGLALVKELCVAMSAEIDVKNRDPGAEFLMLFSTEN